MTESHSSRVVSLYSGAGGLDIGFAQAGFKIIFANDISSDAIATHEKLRDVTDPQWLQAAQNLHETQTHVGDVRTLGHCFEPGMAELVIGGPPCQGFSVAGKMDPNDPRSKHVFDFLGLVARIKPKAFVMENVAALARNSRWSEVIAELQEIASVNYQVQIHVLNASHWGVPQARERMFLIGLPIGAKPVDFSNPPTLFSPPCSGDTLRSLPPAGSPGNSGVCTARITLAKNPVLRKSPFAGMLFNGQGRVIDPSQPSPTLPASMGGNRTPIIDTGTLADPGKAPWVVSYHRRLTVEGKSPLEELPREACLRRLTVQEAAALQTFPSDVQWQGAQSSQFRQIGNAVPPLLAFHVADRLRTALEIRID